MGQRNWFDAGGQAYARFRPSYPPELAEALAALAPSRRLAVDVGCGNGQLTTHLAGLFDAVIGVDPSADQIAHATPHERITYVRAPAESLPVDDASTDLVTAAQAAHWFDLPAFYAEVRRVAVRGAALALVSYGMPQLESRLDDRFQHFHAREVGPYWPPQRALVDDAYASVGFPFEEIPFAPIDIEQQMTLGDLLGYVSTWSAVRAASEDGRQGLLTTFSDDLSTLWGDPEHPHRVRWPVNARVGKL